MKKNIVTFLLILLASPVFAQKTIENPTYGYSTLPGDITKIEILEDATVISFLIKYNPGNWIVIPKKTFIKNTENDNQLFVTKTEGIPLNERYTMPESGEVSFKLYFPKLSNDVIKIDYGEGNEGGTWFVYDIVIDEGQLQSEVPKAILGNWLKTDGSNQWEYSFLRNKAIVDAAVWNYESVETKKNKHTITLEKDGQIKTVYVKIDKNGQVNIGENKKALQAYSNKPTNNPNYQLSHDEPYKWPIFNKNSATYSGVINGYTPRIGQSTTMLYVNNVFTGDQETHLIQIAEDGRFSIQVPIAYPQFVLVRGVGANMNVFIEPGKETFHFIDSGKHLFMGDCAQVNADFLAMNPANYAEFQKIREEILVLSPQDYKKRIIDIQNREMAALNNLVQKQFISQKALQLKKWDIEISALENILSYEMYKRSALRKQAKEKQETAPVDETPLDASYYNVVTKELLDNKLAVMASPYWIFINRLMYADIFRGKSGVRLGNSKTTAQLADQLEKLGAELTDEEMEMVEASKKVQTEAIRKRQNEFYEKYQEKFSAFLRQHYKVFNEIGKDKEKALDMVASLKAEGIELDHDTENMLRAYNALSTPEEKKEQLVFDETYGDALKAFYEKHKNLISEIFAQDYNDSYLKKMQDVFGVEDAFVFDIIKLQRNLGDLQRNMVPYTDVRVARLQEQITTPFLSDYVIVENDKLKAKLEANKTKEGYAVNQVEKSEGDELFHALVKKFRGKVVYVDFWATWCGRPCKSGIKKIKPLKEEMQGEDVVFLYITGPSSPETTWKNSIPDIKGEHYRVSNDEWNYLMEKFKVKGIPHYTLVDKKGGVVKEKLGHLPNNQLKTLLLEEAAK